MNKEQRKELKRLAAGATPGPWIAAGPSFGGPMPVYCNDVCVDREGDDDDTYSVCGAPIGMDKEASSDMEYIAAANPKAITALLSALEAAEAECERLRSATPQQSQPLTDEQKNAMWVCAKRGLSGGLPEDYYIQGVDDAINELEAYRYGGWPCYEVRALVALPEQKK